MEETKRKKITINSDQVLDIKKLKGFNKVTKRFFRANFLVLHLKYLYDHDKISKYNFEIIEKTIVDYITDKRYIHMNFTMVEESIVDPIILECISLSGCKYTEKSVIVKDLVDNKELPNAFTTCFIYFI